MSDWNPDLFTAIKSETSDPLLQQALLIGSYGESTWGQSGNIFGFTSSSYAGDSALGDQGQVAAILPSYVAAEKDLPAGLSGAAAAEWIALGAERPAFSTPTTISDYGLSINPSNSNQELETVSGTTYVWNDPVAFGVSEQTAIQKTKQFTQYGANQSLNQNTFQSAWNQIITAQKQAGINPKAKQVGTSPGAISSGGSGSNAGSGAGSSGPVTPAGNLLTSDPSTQSGFGNQAASAIAQTTNPFVTSTKSTDPSKSASGWLTDAIGLLTFGSLAQTGGPVNLVKNTLDTDANAAATIAGTTEANIWSIVTSGLVRIGIGIVGLMFVAAGLYLLVTHFGGGATPVPIPV